MDISVFNNYVPPSGGALEGHHIFRNLIWIVFRVLGLHFSVETALAMRIIKVHIFSIKQVSEEVMSFYEGEYQTFI